MADPDRKISPKWCHRRLSVLSTLPKLQRALFPLAMADCLRLLLPSASRPARRPLSGMSRVGPCISPGPVGTSGRPTNGLSDSHGTVPAVPI
jgi:hypothetical protein